MRTKTQEIFMYERHRKFLEQTAARAEEMAQLIALPIEFVRDAVMMETDAQIETHTFSPVELMEKIGFLIQGRFAVDDYDLLINPADKPTRRANKIIINGDPSVQVTTSEAMLCSILYNLAKNAGKAHAEKHHAENDQALIKAYRDESELQHPLSINLSMQDHGDALSFHVADEGTGLSLDGSLQRLHDTLSEQIRLHGATNVRNSEWFWNMRRVLGEQAESIIAWPDNPYALRELTVATIMDCQLVNAFGKSGRNLRTFTSGMGLWGVRYMTERLKGTVIMTNKFEGGALFSVTIPKSSLSI